VSWISRLSRWLSSGALLQHPARRSGPLRWLVSVGAGLVLALTATGLLESAHSPHPRTPPGSARSPEAVGSGAPSPSPAASAGVAVPAPAPLPDAVAAAGTSACAASDLGVGVTTDRASYPPGDTLRVTSSVVDRSARPCTVLARCAPPDVFATYLPSRGVHTLEYYEASQHRPCSPAVSAHLLRPGEAVTQVDAAPARLPAGGPGCGAAGVTLIAQVFVLGADGLVHAVQATRTVQVTGAPCPPPTRHGPLGVLPLPPGATVEAGRRGVS
jgi:hypothetical protein